MSEDWLGGSSADFAISHLWAVSSGEGPKWLHLCLAAITWLPAGVPLVIYLDMLFYPPTGYTDLVISWSQSSIHEGREESCKAYTQRPTLWRSRIISAACHRHSESQSQL